MAGTGYLEQKSVRPGGFALVIALHGAAFAALMLVKTTIVDNRDRPIEMIDILAPREKQDPPPEPRQERAQQPSTIDVVPPIVETEPRGPVVDDPPLPPLPPSTGDIGPRTVLADAGTPDLPPPVRVEAQLDGRNLQPPYPPSEESAQREGRVQIRVTIGADGRVRAAERVSATSDAFWRATERHALARWRFRPATLDGRPIESRKVITVHFQIDA